MNSPKLICVILRGGMDGLSAITRPNDPHLSQSRSALIPQRTLSLIDGFALHPTLRNLHKFFHDGDLSFMHACGLPFRDRSHFKSQDILESGLEQSYPETGWLGRAMEATSVILEGIAYGTTAPLLLRGSSKSFNWSNPKFKKGDEYALNMMREQLYKNEAPLESAMQQTNRLKKLITRDTSKRPSQDPFDVIGSLVAKFDGPDIGIISMTGWDTHDDQARRLKLKFSRLDTGMKTLQSRMQDVWDKTVIIIASEFGRSIRQNGTSGTDHGTGGVVIIAGGAISGGQSLGIWPGLKDDQLYEGRDLFPSNDIRDIFANVLAEHFDLPHKTITEDIFPGISKNYKHLPLLERRQLV